MGRKTLTLVLLIIAFSCKKENFNINGKLYFKSIEFVNLFHANNDEKLKFKDYFSGLNTSATLSEDEKKLVSYFRTLEKFNLVDSPYIKILDDKGKVFTVFTTESDYLKFVNFVQDFLRFYLAAYFL